MKIGIANDHGGVEVKQELIKYLVLNGYQVTNYGTDTEDSVDYPNYAFKVGECQFFRNVKFRLFLIRSDFLLN